MNDFKVVRSRVLLNIRQVFPVRGVSPPTLLVLGDRLDRTFEVLYNNVSIKDFLISSPSRLLIRIPDAMVGQPFDNLLVYADGPVRGENASVSLEVFGSPKVTNGMERLVQAFLLEFNTTPGTDMWNPGDGGGGRKIVGISTDETRDSVSARLALGIERARSSLVRKQTMDSRIPPSEKLLSVILQGVEFDPVTTSTNAQVLLENMLRNQAQISLG